MEPKTFRRIEISFRKVGDSRFLSHLDVVRTMERAIRRSALPVRFTEGMNPKVRMSFPTALPLGLASWLELVEIQVETPVTVRETCERLAAELPEGLGPVGGEVLYSGEKRKVRGLHYRVFAGEAELPTGAEIDALLARESIPVERRGKTRDLKPLLASLGRRGDRISLSIAWTDGGTARPEDVLRALGRDPAGYRVEKIGATLETSFGEKIEKRNGP